MTKKKNEHAGHFHTGLLVSSLSLALTAVAADPAHSGDRLGFPSYEQRVILVGTPLRRWSFWSDLG